MRACVFAMLAVLVLGSGAVMASEVSVYSNTGQITLNNTVKKITSGTHYTSSAFIRLQVTSSTVPVSTSNPLYFGLSTSNMSKMTNQDNPCNWNVTVAGQYTIYGRRDINSTGSTVIGYIATF